MDDKNREFELELQARYERRIEEIMKALDEIREECSNRNIKVEEGRRDNE